MNPLDAFERILESLHRAALDDAHWPATAALIDEAVGSVSSGLGISEGFGSDAHVHYVGSYHRGERRRDLEREYLDVYHPHDERLERLRRLPGGRLFHVPELYSEGELKTSFAYNEGLHRFGSQNGLNVRFDGPDGLHFSWGIGNPVGSGGWQSAQLALIERLLPHIRQFVLMRQALAGGDAVSRSLEALLDNRRIGVMHLDRRGRVLAANGTALEVLRRGEALFDEGGMLHARPAAEESRLQRLLAGALPGTGNGIAVSGSITLHRRSDAAGGLGLHVSPVAGAQAEFGVRRVAALLLVIDPASRPRIEAPWVAQALGLTAAESRVAARLAEGRSVRDIAAAAGHKESYVRALLRSIYKKRGLSGQVELVRRVLALEGLPRP